MSHLRWFVLGIASAVSLAGVARAQAEPNDTCATASAIPPGTYPGLVVADFYNPPCCESTDFDYYRVTVPADHGLRVVATPTSTFGNPANFYTSLREGCGGIWIPGQADGSYSATNTSGAPRDYVITVHTFLVDEGYVETTYTLEVVVAPTCATTPDDAFELPAGLVRPIGFGTVTGLFASYFDDDLYRLSLPAGTTIRASIALQHAAGDLDLSVYDGFASASSTSLTDQEVVTFTTSGPGLNAVHVRIAAKPGAVDTCNHYALTVELVATSLGTSYCAAGVNGSAMEARLATQGSSSVAANDLRFVCQSFPGPNSAVLFAGTQATSIPFGDGWRCVGGSVMRLRSAVAVNGVMIVQPDFTTAAGASIVPGTTWNYQVLYRDQTVPGGAGFNLTDALAIPMTP